MSIGAGERVGVLIIGRKRPGFDQDWNRTMVEQALRTLATLGYDAARPDQPVKDDETAEAAARQLRAGGCDTVVVLQPSLGSGQVALRVAQEWAGPIVLWATPERLDSATVSSCSLVAQHLWGSIFRLAKHPFELVYGTPGDPALDADLRQAIGVARVSARLRRAKLGLVGSHVPGFVTMAPDGFLLQRTTGTQLHQLSLPQFFARARELGADRVRQDVEQVRALSLPMNGVTVEDLPTNSRFYLALRDLLAEESLDALAVQCWPEFAEFEGQWPYLALSRLTQEDVAVSLEGDVDGALTALVGKLLDAGPGFVTDWLEHDDRAIHFWHPGTAPLRMCQPAGSSGGPSLGRHFNIQKPLVVDGPLQVDQPLTVARFWRCDGEYRAAAFEGRTVPAKRRLPGNAALVEVDGGGVRRKFDELLHEGLPHHVVLFFGHHAESFRKASRMLGVRWVA